MPDGYWSTRLWFVRHGQARAADGSYGCDTPLSPLGRKQAQAVAVASLLAFGTRPTSVFTSPYPRAVETARPSCDRYGISSIVDERLAEFELPTVAFEDVAWRPDLELWRPEDSAVPGGETLGAFSVRVAAFCEEVVPRHGCASVVVFTHSGVIDAALRWAVGLTPEDPWGHDFDLPTGSVTGIEVWPRGRAANGAPRYCAIGRIGDVSHLGRLVSDG